MKERKQTLAEAIRDLDEEAMLEGWYDTDQYWKEYARICDDIEHGDFYRALERKRRKRR